MTARYEIRINRPPAVVFAWLDEPARVKQWLTTLVEMQPLTPGVNRVGAKARHIYNENGRRVEMEEETLIYEPGQHIKIRGTTKGFHMTAEYRLQPDGAGTLLTFESAMHFKSLFMRLLGPLLARAASQSAQKDLQRLKTLAEAQG